MFVLGIAAAVVAVTLVVLAAFMIPAVIELRKAAVAMSGFIAQTESDIKPVLKDLHETLSELKVLTEGAAAKVDDVQSFMEAIGDAGKNIRTINNVVGRVADVLSGSSVWITGIKVASKFIMERVSKKRGN